MATQTKAKYLVFCGMHDILPNTPMASRIFEHITQIGLPEYTEEEQEFAKKLQISVGKPATGMKYAILPPFDIPPTLGGSSDVGDISYNTPTMGVIVQTIPPGCGARTWQATAAHGMALGHKAVIMGAKALASLGCDSFTDAALLASAKADYEKRKGDYVFKSPLSSDMKRPLELDAIDTGDAFLEHLHSHDPSHDQSLAHMEQHMQDTHGN
jgi:aminobenzoyl-glutamate utilization protein B